MAPQNSYKLTGAPDGESLGREKRRRSSTTAREVSMKTTAATANNTGKPSPSPAAPVAVAAANSSDSTEPSAPPEVEEDLSASLTQTYEPPRRKILCNPSAGEVYKRERGSPWRVDVDEKLRLANLKAKEEQQEKRRWGLAKQIQDGLMHTFGMNYGVPELSTLLKTGIALKTAQQQQQQQETGVGAGKPTELGGHEVAYVQLLAAAEKYDLKQVVMLLDKFPKGRNTSSNSSPKRKLTKS